MVSNQKNYIKESTQAVYYLIIYKHLNPYFQQYSHIKEAEIQSFILFF
ncbi:hypothetical protein ['Camptotheca acuminata' phytoplasma]